MTKYCSLIMQRDVHQILFPFNLHETRPDTCSPGREILRRMVGIGEIAHVYNEMSYAKFRSQSVERRGIRAQIGVEQRVHPRAHGQQTVYMQDLMKVPRQKNISSSDVFYLS